MDVNDFSLTTSSKITGANVTSVAGSGSEYTVTVNTGSGAGTLRLDVRDNDSILSAYGVPLGGGGVGNGDFTTGPSYLLRPLTKVFRSQGAYDGWILETGEFTNMGGTVNSVSDSLIMGDDAANQQYRSLISFDTSSMPDTAVITGGMLKFRKKAVVGTDPFTTHGQLRLEFRKGFFGSVAALESDDFQAPFQYTYVFPYEISGGLWYNIRFDAALGSHMNVNNLIQFRMRFFLDDNNDDGTDSISFYSGDAASASYWPALVVEYYEQ
jgi:hypothetical protein